MKYKFRLTLLLAAISFTFTKANTKETMDNINAFLKKQIDKNTTPSVQYIFFDADSAIYQFICGRQDVAANKEADSNTVYNFFSVTKTFTATAILQLQERGLIDIKAPAVCYIEEFPYGEDITVEQLLNHTSGIPNPMPLKWIHLRSEHEDFDAKLFFDQIFDQHRKLSFDPGTKFAYSNLEYVLLGRIIELVSGMTYEQYIEQNIIGKLQLPLSDLGFGTANTEKAKGYQKTLTFTNFLLGLLIDKRKFMGPAEESWKPFKEYYLNGTPYGGMEGTANGLVRFGQELIKKSGLILNEDSKKQMFAEHYINAKPTGMGLAWFTGMLMGNRYVGHAGGGGGYYSEFRLYPELGVGSLVLYNRTGMTDEKMLDKIDRYFISK